MHPGSRPILRSERAVPFDGIEACAGVTVERDIVAEPNCDDARYRCDAIKQFAASRDGWHR